MGVELLVAAAVVGTGASIVESRKGRKDQQRAAAAQQRIQERRAARQRSEQLRAAQRETAEIQAAAAAQGVSQEASVVRGGVASVQSQSASNISFINQVENAQRQIVDFQNKAALSQSKAGAFSQLASLAGTAATSQSTQTATPEGTVSG